MKLASALKWRYKFRSLMCSDCTMSILSFKAFQTLVENDSITRQVHRIGTVGHVTKCQCQLCRPFTARSFRATARQTRLISLCTYPRPRPSARLTASLAHWPFYGILHPFDQRPIGREGFGCMCTCVRHRIILPIASCLVGCRAYVNSS
jgi:hypothetical protein